MKNIAWEINQTLPHGIRLFILFIVILFSFRIPAGFPGEETYYLIEVVYLLMILIFIFTYLFDRINRSLPLFKIEWYILILFLFLPFYSAFLAHKNFGQPYIFGILAERSWILVLSAVLLFFLLRIRFVELEDFEKIFLFLAWLTFLSYLIIVTALNPQDYADSTRLFQESASRGGVRIKLNHLFLTFGCIYYYIKFHREKNIKFLIYASTFLIYIVFIYQGRTLSLSLLSSLFIYFFFHIKRYRKIIIVYWALVFIISGVFILYIYSPQTIDRYIQLYKNILILFQGDKSFEGSVNIRALEASNAIKYMAKGWQYVIFGSGKLSHQWQGGFGSVFGYFAPSDIGLIGTVLVYGIFGNLLIYSQYYLGYRFHKKMPGNNLTVFELSLIYFYIYFFIHSITTGRTVFFQAIPLIILVLIFFSSRKKIINVEK